MNFSEQRQDVLLSVRTLLADAIDYAGLFPPANLSMSEAVINYAAYRNSDFRWMLGRFVVTAARLGEFLECARDLVSGSVTDPWRLSVLVGEDVTETIHEIKEFNALNSPAILCDMLEIKGDSAGIIENAAMSIPETVTAYFELSLDERLADLVSTLAIRGQRAKIRTGGITPESFPTSNEIVRFVRTCVAANVPFKATAGLHHPVRCFRPLTYESNAPTGTMHGFLNFFLMTGFAREGYRPNLLVDLMEEEFEEVFRFEEQAAIWRDDYVLSQWQIAASRQKGIQSFGSCSFDEPIADMQKLGIL